MNLRDEDSDSIKGFSSQSDQEEDDILALGTKQKEDNFEGLTEA